MILPISQTGNELRLIANKKDDPKAAHQEQNKAARTAAQREQN